MIGSSESASSSPARILVCAVNWVGDSIMSMPALQAMVTAGTHPAVTLLAKPSVAPLWRMHRAGGDIVLLRPGLRGAYTAAMEIRRRRPARAVVLPHSFRSALVPFLARVPERIGMPGHFRDAMLSRVVPPGNTQNRRHQAWEYMDLLAPEFAGPLPAPELTIPPAARDEAARLLDGNTPWVGLVPGAARGPSKRWPAERFLEVARRLSDECRIAVIGAPGEEALCASIADPLGPAARNLAGQLSFPAWAAVLAACRVVVANDSGGMHLAAALGTPVVALFGATDPERTGPLGPARILQQEGPRSRTISRDSTAARFRLASIPSQAVYEAVNERLQQREVPADA